jgi:hypothetical protein
MSLRVWHRLTIIVGLVVSACGDGQPKLLPDAAPPDAAPDAAPPDAAPDAPPDAAPFCGDGVRREGEECDGQDLGEKTCADEGYYAGQLTCRAECKVDAAGCSGRCGDGAINGPEGCDAALPVAGTCRSRGFLAGAPACSASCSLLGCRNSASSNDDIVLWGRDAASRLGASMAFAGDVDGDGRDDLLAAAPGEVRVLGKRGAVYLVAGSADGRATINDAARFVDDSWDDAGSLVLHVGSARDLDGDGRADFLIAALTASGALDVYLVYGRAEPFVGTLKLADLVEGGDAARFSTTLASAGVGRRAALGVPDVTGDGRDDLLVAVSGYGGGLGALYVIPGDPIRYSGTLVLPAPVAPLPLPVRAAIVGSTVDSALGNDLAAGDLDGDGVADLLVTSGGDAQIFYGPIAGALSPADAAAHTELGAVTSLAAADLDGDHDAELVVTRSSEAALFFGGSPRRDGPLMASDADHRVSTAIHSEVRTGGDVDGDGHAELIFTQLSFESAVAIVAGPITPPAGLSLDPHEPRWRLTADQSSSEDPLDVALGDFNGDGFDDVAVATKGGLFGGNGRGVVHIVHGATPPGP